MLKRGASKFIFFLLPGIDQKFESYSVRILIVALFIKTIVVCTYYTSYLVAVFSVFKISLPFEDLQGLYSHRKEYHLGLVANSSIVDELRVSA